MVCPVCSNVDLKMTERQGIEIDYCPKCRGVWLDRGELDKIIEFSKPQSDDRGDRRPANISDDRDRGYYHEDRSKRKRKSILGEIFDF